MDCSWVKCVANVYGGYDKEKQGKQNALAALRNEAFRSDAMQEVSGPWPFWLHCTPIHSDQQARDKLGNTCCRCQKKSKRMVVDHSGKPFARIVDEFLDDQGATLASLKVQFSRGSFWLRTRGMSKDWRAFHDGEAKLEGLCAKCNGSLGSRGYRHVQA